MPVPKDKYYPDKIQELTGLTAANRFVEHLTGSPDTPVHLRMIPDDKSRKELRSFNLKLGSVAERWPEIEAAQAQGYGAFMVVNDGGKRGADITRVRALFVDSDGTSVPAEWHSPPAFLAIRADDHWHAYWPVDDLPLDQFTDAQDRLQQRYGTDPNVSDLPRVMRLPGTRQLKPDEGGKEVRLRELAPFEPWTTRPATSVLAGLSPLPQAARAKVVDMPDPRWKPLTVEKYRKMLSHIDPRMKVDRNGCYGDENPPNRPAWVGVANCILGGDVPLAAGAEVDEEQLAFDWSTGALWRERLNLTEQEFPAPQPAHVDDPDAFLEDVRTSRRPGERRTGVGSLLRLANQNGFTGRMDRESPELDAAVSDALAKDAVRAVTANVDRSKIVLQDEAMQDAEPEIEWLVEGILQVGATTVISAAYGSFKSFIALELAFSVATGLPVGGEGGLPVLRSGPVVYLTTRGEGAQGIKKQRRPAWRLDRKIPEDRRIPFYLVDTVPQAGNDADLKRYTDAIDGLQMRPELIVVDTMSRSLGTLNESDAADAAKYIKIADELVARYGCPVLTIAHTGWDGSKVRGSSNFPSSFMNVLDLTGDRKALTAKLSGDKIKDGDVAEGLHFQGRVVRLPAGPDGKARSSLVFDLVSAEVAKAATESTRDRTVRSIVDDALKELWSATPGLDHVLSGPLSAEYVKIEERDRKAQAERQGVDFKPLTAEQLERRANNVRTNVLSPGAKEGSRLWDFVVKDADGNPRRDKQSRSFLWRPPPKSEAPPTGSIANDMPDERV